MARTNITAKDLLYPPAQNPTQTFQTQPGPLTHPDPAPYNIAQTRPISAPKQPSSNSFAPAPVNPNVAAELGVAPQTPAYRTEQLPTDSNFLDEIGSFLENLFSGKWLDGDSAAAAQPAQSAPGLPAHSVPMKQNPLPQSKPAPTPAPTPTPSGPTMLEPSQLGEMFGTAAAQSFIPGAATPDFQLPPDLSGFNGVGGQNPIKY